MDIGIPLLLCVTHGPGNLHMTKHVEVPNYSQEEFFQLGLSFRNVDIYQLKAKNWV